MSDVLLQFLIDYTSWAQEDITNNPYGFSAGCGLCRNLTSYCIFKRLSNEDIDYYKAELTVEFIANNLDPIYPFNSATTDYEVESLNRITHLNTDRINFCINTIKKYYE